MRTGQGRSGISLPSRMAFDMTELVVRVRMIAAIGPGELAKTREERAHGVTMFPRLARTRLLLTCSLVLHSHVYLRDHAHQTTRSSFLLLIRAPRFTRTRHCRISKRQQARTEAHTLLSPKIPMRSSNPRIRPT